MYTKRFINIETRKEKVYSTLLVNIRDLYGKSCYYYDYYEMNKNLFDLLVLENNILIFLLWHVQSL